MTRILDHRARLDDAPVGGKLARQRRLAAAGIPVPRFFCLSGTLYREVTDTLREQVAAILRGLDFNAPATVRDAAGRIEDLFRGLALPARLEQEILAAFDATFATNDLVAVRASTVGHHPDESEDSARDPFAGMSATFLCVPREQVLTQIRRCWSSGFSFESLTYRHAQGLDLTGFDVAVGVQKMIQGTRSFVLFTCDPQAATRDAVIAAGYGIGEGVVQERVGVDHYFVNRRTGEVRREVADKAEQLVLDDDAGWGLTSRPVPPALRQVPCLTDDEVRQIVAVGEHAEALFGAPQDLEGTFDADGALHILQARPIVLDFRRIRVFTNANVTESFPGVTTALTYSHARYFYRVIFYDCYRRLGVDPRRLHDQHEWLDHMIAFLEGRIYYCLTSFYHLHRQSPLFPLFRAHWERMMGFRSSIEEAPTGLMGETWRRLRSLGRLTSAVVVVGWRYLTHERALGRFYAWWDDLMATRRGGPAVDRGPGGGPDPLLLVEDFRRVWTEVGNRWGITLLNDTYLPVIYGVVEGLLRRWGLAQEEGLLSDLLCGDEELRSVAIVLSVVALSETVRHDPEVAQAFATQSPRELWQAGEEGHLPEALRAAIREHLRRHGDRGLEELKLEVPSLRHEPWRLMEMITAYARREVTVAGLAEEERQVRQAAEERLQQRLRGHPLRRRVLRFLLRTLRRLIRNRENSRYCRSELFGYSKGVFGALGAHLAHQGVLRDPSDAFHLTQDELFGWVDGTGITTDLQALADLRRAEHQARQETQLPMELTTMGAVGQSALGTTAAGSVAGEGAATTDGAPTSHATATTDGVPTSHAAATTDGAPTSQATATTDGAPTGAAAKKRSLVLQGLGSSAGRVQGVARVVLDPHLRADLGDDAILVARETDPGWLFLMLAAKGIVVERGSMLSHTAITGRKFGIPTVVAVPDATTRIPEGARVEIDGGAGTVRVLAGPPAASAKPPAARPKPPAASSKAPAARPKSPAASSKAPAARPKPPAPEPKPPAARPKPPAAGSRPPIPSGSEDP